MTNPRIRLHNAKVGIVPLNWKYDPNQKEKFLLEIAQYGFAGIQVSGEQAESSEFRELMKKYNVAPAEQYLPIKCNEDGLLSGAEAEAELIIKQAAGAGVEMIVFAADGSEDRDRSAGNADNGPGLSEMGFKVMAEFVERHAAVAATHGMKSSFHPHGATYIETPRETKKLMAMLSEKIGLCLDVGHWIVGGGDPVLAVSDYGDRISHVHVKDVSGDVLAKMISKEVETMGFAVDELKLFVPAGTGLLKVKELFIALDKLNYSGWLMSEQDTAWEPSQEASAVSMANIQAALTN